MDTVIPDNADPTPALDKLAAHFGRLAECQASIPQEIQALILMAKIPPSMSVVAQTACQAESPKELNPDKMR